MRTNLKETIKKFLKWVGKAFIAGLCAVLLLSLFCIVYSYDGVHVENKTGATDYVWEAKQLKTTMKEGFSWFFCGFSRI